MSNLQLKLFAPGDFLTLTEASEWAAEHLGKKVTNSNISYLINYGRITKYGENGNAFISKNELKFSIRNIKMTFNEAFEVEEVNESK